MKHTEAVVVIAFGAVGLAWSWLVHIYDLRSPTARLLVTAVGFAVSFCVMWAGLRNTPRSERPALAARAVLPFNGLRLSQVAYIGYMFIPLEVLASALLLRAGRGSFKLSRVGAFALAFVTRGVAFVVTIAMASAVRRWLPG